MNPSESLAVAVTATVLPTAITSDTCGLTILTDGPVPTWETILIG